MTIRRRRRRGSRRGIRSSRCGGCRAGFRFSWLDFAVCAAVGWRRGGGCGWSLCRLRRAARQEPGYGIDQRDADQDRRGSDRERGDEEDGEDGDVFHAWCR